MWKKLCDAFAGPRLTIVSGVFLAASLILMLTDTQVPVDPAWVTVVLSGYPLLYLAITRLVYRKWVSSCLLISMAMVASLAIGELFAAGEVAFIMSVGAILEDMTVARAKKGLHKLISLAPTMGHRITDGGTEDVRAEDIRVGDRLRVLPGETIPVDGTVITGRSSVDQAVMTGESLPVEKDAGDPVFCGTTNQFGSIDMEATAVGQDSSLQKMIRMVQEADEKKAPMQRIADQWSVWLVPVALAIAVIGFLVNYFALRLPIMEALESGVTVLVVFCPCALALATPTSIMAAIGQATKHGVIIKSGEALEAMGRCDTIAFDKTGTLTRGDLAVTDCISLAPELTADQLLALAAAAESRSEHPLGRAIVAGAAEKQLALPEIENFSMVVGRGVEVTVDGRTVLCGSEAFFADRSIPLTPEVQTILTDCHSRGSAAVLVAADGACIGAVALGDVLREEAPWAVSSLRDDVRTQSVLLTGDNDQAARFYAGKAGITQIRSQLLPGGKVEAVEDLQEDGHRVCMVGDGVNDAPALKTASVGVAMGTMGSDVAIEAADIALMGDDLRHLVYLKKLAAGTIRTIKFNITASMCINAVAVTLSVLRVLNPVTGALVHNLGSALVVLNAALLYDRNFEK